MSNSNQNPIEGAEVHSPRDVALRQRFVVIGCLVIIAGIGIRLLLVWLAGALEIDSAPLPRPIADAPFIPTPQDVVDKMLEVAQVTKDDLVYDLGCGDGRIVVTAAKRFGCTAVGYDKDPERVRDSLANVKKNKVEHLVTIEERDVFTLDLRQADVITIYLLPRMIVKLIPQLQRLKPSTRIVAHDFGIEGIEPDSVVEMRSKDGRDRTVYLYSPPLKRTKPKSVPRLKK